MWRVILSVIIPAASEIWKKSWIEPKLSPLRRPISRRCFHCIPRWRCTHRNLGRRGESDTARARLHCKQYDPRQALDGCTFPDIWPYLLLQDWSWHRKNVICTMHISLKLFVWILENIPSVQCDYLWYIGVECIWMDEGRWLNLSCDYFVAPAVFKSSRWDSFKTETPLFKLQEVLTLHLPNIRII